jgi:hypothetical protein
MSVRTISGGGEDIVPRPPCTEDPSETTAFFVAYGAEHQSDRGAVSRKSQPKAMVV